MVKELLRYLNDDYKFISRQTVAAEVYKLYEKEKENLKVVLATCSNRICLTSDIWTGCTSEGYMCLTAHFIEENWNLNSKILSFFPLPPPHSGVEIAKKLLNCLTEWGLEKKIFSLTLDNASANDNMQELVKEQLCLGDGFLCKGKFFHVRCCAHILNLIMQDGLKVIADALHKVRDSVKYVTSSESRVRMFESCVMRVGRKSGAGLVLDVVTRWNSTYVMLSRVILYKSAFMSLKLYDKNYKFCPSDEEWAMADKICEILEPFDAMTNLMSGSKYPTSNLYFTQIWTIQCLLKKHGESEIGVINDMIRKMQEKFDKYWEDYSIVLAMDVVLDPRMKLQLLESCYIVIDANTAKEKIEIVKRNMYMLYEEYKKSSAASPVISTPVVHGIGRERGGMNSNFLNRLIALDSQNVVPTKKSHLDEYLEERKLEMALHNELDVLQY